MCHKKKQIVLRFKLKLNRVPTRAQKPGSKRWAQTKSSRACNYPSLNLGKTSSRLSKALLDTNVQGSSKANKLIINVSNC